MYSRRDVLYLALALAAQAGLALRPYPAAAAERVRVGVLKFGTVSWALDTIKHHGFDIENGIDLDIVHFAGEDASNVAMLAGEVDIIVSDWLWVSRQRAMGDDLTLLPYSAAVGAIMVREDSPLTTLADLKGRRIGIAGGPLDKSWLLIRAVARRDHDLDLAGENELVYGAPPLLAEKAMQGELDAVLNFWHYCARLEADGFRRLFGADDAIRALGASGKVSALGYVFHESWAARNTAAITGFARASAAAKELLATSDEEWQRLAPLARAQGKELEKLRERYREGIPRRPISDEEADAARLYDILAQIGGEALVGPSPDMAPGTYWTGVMR
ncbi:ABC transporter substrate-binding protein [Chelativorans sp. M5D2P16]|uniref:ABC transporter substrate-binding protein n=1 Tax=Chelativorans sp. M5D2P16 TaxID=3095678 RepID=UPI002ACAF335|nr:ABC transporter substrate-binding protein [Chelativorans sp. M5D2P16]MDZ5695822.1 ABC transporter substrate-binding protein [Chelativorans sp. M5D2P16]